MVQAAQWRAMLQQQPMVAAAPLMQQVQAAQHASLYAIL